MNYCQCGCGLTCRKRFVVGHGRRNTVDSFWSKVNKTNSCWLWTKGKTKAGYGTLGFRGRDTYAHRLSWILFNGEIPNGLHVLHNCPSGDNPACVNPSHLFLGTQGDNVRDAARKGRFGDRKGENSPRAVLKSEYVPAIRCMHSEGWTQKSIANQFGVSRGAIQQIVNGNNWKCVS